MHEVKEKAMKICELKDRLMCEVRPYVEAGVFCKEVDGMAVGQVIDMIKDLCDSEKNLFKACYYKTVTEAMKKAEENDKDWMKMCAMMAMANSFGGNTDENAKMGYDNWRYASGQFAPKGKGHYAGYTPNMHMPEFENPMARNEEMLQQQRGMLGYSGSGSSRGGSSNDSSSMSSQSGQSNSGYRMFGSQNQGGGRRTGRYGYPMDEKYGMAYNDYNDARRHYHESKDPKAKEEMDEHISEHFEDTLETTKEMWKDARPEMKKEFKKQMMELLKDIPV